MLKKSYTWGELVFGYLVFPGQDPQDPARVKPLPLAAISFYLHKLFVPLHVKKGGVISRDLGYSTQKKKADFASAGPADTEYQNSHCVLWPRSRYSYHW